MSLITYKASAGSGKTYTITREYLRWLLASSSTSAYRQILAVTFTNKATDEMKKRIVGALDKVARGADTDLEKEFCESLSLSPDALRERAIRLRSAILHDYSHFAVSTIDTFFQKILHAFVREAGLLPGFTLELDHERLVDEAIDGLLRDTANDSMLCQWLTDLIETRIESGKTWDVRKQLKEMAEEIFKERFSRMESAFTEKLSDKNFLAAYAKTLQSVINEFEQSMSQLGKEALQLLSKHGLHTGDFKYKASSFVNYFNKLATKSEYEPKPRVLEAQNEVEKWYGSDATKHAQIDAVFPALNALLVKAVENYEKNFMRYQSVRTVWRNFYSMGLLADMALKIKTIANDENVLPISDSLRLLQALIGEHDTPFVYEKTGARYRSFMLDEFQDTSAMQWHNLRPLLHNGLAEGGNALVVGDVKQSIYRWRNGDWRILAYQLQKDFEIFHPQSIALDTNWRSLPEIIRVNNDLFTRLPQLLQAQINNEIDSSNSIYNEENQALRTIVGDAYADAVQQASPKKKEEGGGYVEIRKLTDTEEVTAREQVLQRLPALVAELQDRGYRASDIAVLVRYGREGQEVADTLLQHKQTANDPAHCFDVVSQDSLFLYKAPVVQLAIALLRQTVAPDDAINNALIKKYHKGEHIPVPAGMPLPEMFEYILQQYQLAGNSRHIPFLQELHDCILQFSARHTSDVYSFLEWWEQQGEKRTVSENEQQEAIRILTIHKSKGLQFRVVIVPFCNWRMEPKTGSLLWLNATEEPLNQLPLLPVNYSQKLNQTFFQNDYFVEKAQSYVDNLNLLYVAFTRAEEELYAFVPQPARKSGYALSDLLPEVLQSDTFTSGIKQAKVKRTEEKMIDNRVLSHYPSQPISNSLRMRYADDTGREPFARRDFGLLMHRVFSMIATADDIDQAITSLTAGGFLENDTSKINELRESILEAIQRPQVAGWFDGSWQLRNEADILLPSDNGQLVQYRPDRVMMRNDEVVVVDYKFGEKQSEHYITQVQNYLRTLGKMNYRPIKGYIWYVSLDEVEEVQ